MKLHSTYPLKTDKKDIHPSNNNNDLIELVNSLKNCIDSIETKLYEAEVRINKFEQYTDSLLPKFHTKN